MGSDIVMFTGGFYRGSGCGGDGDGKEKKRRRTRWEVNSELSRGGC